MSMTMTLGEQTLEFLNQFDDFKRSIKHMADLDDYEYTKWLDPDPEVGAYRHYT
jgi:hypothetical protein